MSRIIYDGRIRVVHTDSSVLEDVSLQKSAWTEDVRANNYARLREICEFENGVPIAKNLAIVGFSQGNNSFRKISKPDDNILVNKKDGNVIITDTTISLMGWAADCLLIAFASEDQQVVAACHASVISLNTGVLDSVVAAFAEYGYDPCDVTAYMGACIGVDSYEYEYERALKDFSDFKDFILVEKESEKVHLDLYGAAKSRLKELGFAKIKDIFKESERDTMTARDKDGEFMFPSYRRDVAVNKDGEVIAHTNGQYGLVIQKADLEDVF